MLRELRLKKGSFLSLALALVLVGGGGGLAQADQALDQLVKNARYWQDQGRTDKAIDSWRRVLVSDPRNAEALVQVGTFHSRRGRLDKAREYLVRLRQVSPAHPGVATLERALATGVGYDEILNQARKLAREGKTDAAADLYRQAVGGGEPPEDLALEYYQTVGGSRDGWDQAQRGLEKLVASTGSAGTRLALAKHLTYREKSRRQGIAQLRDLAAEPRLGEEARKAWRQALLWLQPAAADGDLFSEYLAGRTDPEVARKAEESRKLAVRPAASAGGGPVNLKAGYEALSRSDLEGASKVFDRAARSNGRDPQALVGMGVVALQQQDFARAREIFTKVKLLVPGKPELWERSLRSASFWSLVREADGLRVARRLDEATRKLEEAARVSPEEKSHATVALAEVSRARGNNIEAEASLRQVLEAEPTHAPALAAMLRLAVEAQRVGEAEELNARLAQIDAAKAWPADRLRAEVLRGRAASLVKSGMLDKARADLIEAHKAAPGSAEVLVDLAYLELQLDELEAAERTVSALGQLAPVHPEILRLRVRWLEAGHRHAEALKLLATVPARDLDESWRLTRNRLEVRAEAAHLVARSHRGALAGSRLRLIELERRAAGQPELLLIVAEAWADAGDTTRAASLAHQVSARVSDLSVGARLHLAAVYLRARRDADLEEVLRELTAEPALTARERADLEKVRVAHAVRRADRLRDKGELELGLQEIAPLLRESPDNPRLLCALGRLFRAGDENREAFQVFQRVLKSAPGDFEARQGAVESALGMHDRQVARLLTEEALKRDPRDARVHLLAGRFAVMTGEDAAAAESFRTAQEILNANSPASPSLASALAMSRTTSDVLQVAAIKLGSGGGGDQAEATQSDLPLQVQAELDRLNAKKSVEVRSDFEVRTREGYGGLAGLTELRVPVSASVPLGFRGRLGFTVTPMVLDTGAITPSPQLVQGFGSLGVDPSTVPGGALDRSVSGATLALSYQHRWLSLDVGSTPLGLPLQTVVGGASVRGQVGQLGLAASASRRSVNDSMLSYVGLKDPVTGATWGRVLSDSARLDLAIDTEPALIYLFGSFARLDGKHVRDNQMVMAGTGAEWELYDYDGTKVVTGLGITYLGYQKNLRYVTIGHGGYFSPQRFIHAGIPLKGQGESGPFSWQLTGDLGLNWFREQAAAYYPTEPAFQNARASLVDAMSRPLESAHPGRNSLSLAADLGGRASYQLTPNVRAGLQVAYRHADYFRELLGGLWVELALRRRIMNRPAGL